MNEKKIKVLVAIGTRPEAIKLAPVVAALREDSRFECVAAGSGQHKEMLQQALADFGCDLDCCFDIPMDGRSLSSLTVDVIQNMTDLVKLEAPDWTIVQGDTTTAFASGLVAFYSGVKVAHVEAGLRSGNNAHPFPEEVNRKLISQFASLHFAPTQLAYDALIREAVNKEQILLSGNTVVDALHYIREKVDADDKIRQSLDAKFNMVDFGQKVILFTSHRRENLGENQIEICAAVREIASRHPDVQIVFPMHLNPAVRSVVQAELSGFDNILLVEPFSYLEIIYVMSQCYLVVTDSGGLQEEAPSFGKPVLVLRETSERMEAVSAGSAKLVGSDAQKIVSEAHDLISCPEAYAKMSEVDNPFGDGTASLQIVEALASTGE